MAKLYLQEAGKGNPILLIHGFPMNSKVWGNFANELSQQHRVFMVDLPGFGKSDILPSDFSLDDVAAFLLQETKGKIPEPYVVLGHSLGGYVALAMVAKDPERFSGLCLLHSTAYPDTSDKRVSRNKVIEFVNDNGAQAFTSNFITPLFADKNHPEIERIRQINMESTAASLKGYTIAMRDRIDRTHVLKSFQKPILMMAGEKDAGISTQSVKEQAILSDEIQSYILDEQVHMAFIEKEQKTLMIINRFMVDCFPEK